MTRQTWPQFTLSVLALLVSCRAKADAPALAPEELLSRYEAHVDGLRTIRFHSKEQVLEKGGAYVDWTWTATTWSDFARGGGRWRFRTNEVGRKNFAGKNHCTRSEGEITFDGKSCILVDRDHRGVRELPEMSRELGEKYLKGKDGGPIETTVSAAFDTEKHEWSEKYATLNQTNPLYGYLPFDHRFITDVLHERTTRLSSRVEEVAGVRAHVLEGVTPLGVITLSLDPARDFAPLRLRVEKSRDHLLNGIPMRLYGAGGRPNGPMPDLPMRRIEFRVDYRTARHGGRHLIQGYTRHDRIEYEGNKEYSRRYEATFSDLADAPGPKDLEPTIPIPEGSLVHVRNDPGIRARWTKGRLVLEDD